MDELFFTPREAIERVEDFGDLFKPVLKKVQRLPADLRRYFQRRQHAQTSRSEESLKLYAAKRDFKKTAEPKPKAPQRRNEQ